MVGRREGEDGGIEFKVSWEGNWLDTWEPEECLEHSKDKIQAYLKERAGQTNKKRKRKRKGDAD